MKKEQIMGLKQKNRHGQKKQVKYQRNGAGKVIVWAISEELVCRIHSQWNSQGQACKLCLQSSIEHHDLQSKMVREGKQSVG